MKQLILFWAALFVSSLGPSGIANDLATIDRTIVKQPAYGAAPRYGLLVLGPKAETRIWLVIDDKTLYVDRNGNGDLTEQGEQVAAEQTSSAPILRFQAGPFVEADGETRHSDLSVYQYFHQQFKRLVHGVSVMDVRGALGQGASAEGGCSFADAPKDAPVIHINGPLTMRAHSVWVDFRRGSGLREVPFELGAGEVVSALHIQVGTPGLGKGTFAALAVETGFPADLHPKVEVVLSSKLDANKTVEFDFHLKERC